MLKTLLTTTALVATMIAGGATAQEPVKLFVGGKPGGTVHTHGTILSEVFKENNIPHEFIQTKGEKAAYNAWLKDGKTGIFTTTTNYVMVVAADSNPEDLVSYEYADPYVMCKRNDAPGFDKNTTVNLAISGAIDQTMIQEMDAQLPINFNLVKFGVSKDINASFEANESQYLFTTLKWAKRAIKSGEATCVMNSGERTITVDGVDVPGITSMVTLTKSAPFETGAVNFSTGENVRKYLELVYDSKQFKDWIDSRGYSLLLSDEQTETALYKQHLSAFGGK